MDSGIWARLAAGGSGPADRQPLETTGQLCQIGTRQRNHRESPILLTLL
jgi:hypothetical protein